MLQDNARKMLVDGLGVVLKRATMYAGDNVLYTAREYNSLICGEFGLQEFEIEQIIENASSEDWTRLERELENV